MNMKYIRHEQVTKGRTLYSGEILKKELNRAIVRAAAVLLPVNAVFVMLAFISDPLAVFDALLIPVCSVLIIVALVFLKNAVVQYFEMISVPCEKSVTDDTERTDVPEKTFLTA